MHWCLPYVVTEFKLQRGCMCAKNMDSQDIPAKAAPLTVNEQVPPRL